METTEESVEQYTESDGTKVVKRTIITRTKPGGGGSSGSFLSRGSIPSSGNKSSGPASGGKPLDIADPKTLNDFEVAFLNKHNEYRAKHGVPLLKLSREVCIALMQSKHMFHLFIIVKFLCPHTFSALKLCNHAQEWAKTIAAKNQLSHRPNNKYGENIFWKSGSNTHITGQ